MPSPNSTFTELVTTTFRKHRKTTEDAISNNNAFYKRMMTSGRKRREDGGLSIVQPLQYAENSTYQRYSGLDTLNIQASDVISAAEYQWRQIAMHIVASGRELRINNGRSRIISLAQERMENAMLTFKNNFSYDLYSDGTLPNQINGIQALIADAGTGTVGGIDSGTWDFWKNKVQSAAAPIGGGAGVTVSDSTIEDLMLGLWLALVRGDDKPDLILADNNYFQFYEQSQLSLKRYTNSDTAQGGFMSLKYKSADVVFDGGSGIPANRMYFINSRYYRIVVHPDADLNILDEMRPINQDGVVIPVLWMGNVTMGNRKLQGVLKP